MDLFELKKKIQSRSLSNFYVFAGEETGMMKIYIAEMAKSLGMSVERLDSVQNVYDRVSRGSLVTISSLFVVQDDKTFLKAEKLWARMPKILRKSALVLIYTKPDKRSRFFKQIDYVAFNPLSSDMLAKYIQKQIPLSTECAQSLAEVCQRSYDRCLHEVDKLLSYISYKQSIGEDITPDIAYRTLLNQGLIYKPIGDITFEIVDAIMERNNLHKIQSCLINMRKKNEPRLLLLSLLYNNFRNQLMFQSANVAYDQIASVTGLSKFEVMNASKRSGRYSNSELKRALDILQSLEFGVKVGNVEELFSIDYFIAQVI